MNKITNNLLGFSYFNPPITVSNKRPDEIYTIQDAFDHIKSGDLEKKTKTLRSLATKAEKDSFKIEKLPFVTWCAVLSVKNQNSVVTRSQYLALDIDGLGSAEDYNKSWEIIQLELKPALMFKSPKGEGFKAIVRIAPAGDESNKDVALYYTSFQKYLQTKFNIKIDSAPKNVSSACFLCHDDNAVLNENAKVFDNNFIKQWESETAEQDQKPQAPPKQSGAYKYTDPMEVAARMIQNSKDGEKHATLIKASKLLGGYVGSGELIFEEAKQRLRKEIKDKNNVDNLETAFKTIEDGLQEGMKNPLESVRTPYIRVGCDFFKLITKTDAHFGIERTELKAWKVREITRDHGKTFVNKIKKFDDFTIEPEHLNYHQRYGNCFNLYSELSHTPEPGEWPTTKLFLEHIFGEQYNLGIRYIQILYLHPKHILPILALVSRERETGKTTFLTWINLIFGNNVANITPQNLSSNFNGSYGYSNLILIEETAIDKREIIEKIKALTTQPYITLNLKGVNESQVPFFGKVILTSNDPDGFIKIDQEEVRFFIRKVGKPIKYIPNIELKLKEEIPAFLYYLTTLPRPDLTIDRSGFTTEELDNDFLRDLKAESHSGLYKALHDHFEELFLNVLKNEKFCFATPTDIKERWFSRDLKIDNAYIRKVLKNEFKFSPPDVIYYEPFGNINNEPRAGKSGRAYNFRREMFVKQEPEKESVSDKLPF